MVFTWALPNPEPNPEPNPFGVGRQLPFGQLVGVGRQLPFGQLVGVGRPMPGGHRVRSEFWIGYLCILLKLIFCYFKKNHKNFYNNTFLGILQVKLAGTTEEPYFCGKDVCEMLGYEIVEPENKKELKYLGPNDPQKVQSNLDTTFLGINRPLTFNEFTSTKTDYAL